MITGEQWKMLEHRQGTQIPLSSQVINFTVIIITISYKNIYKIFYLINYFKILLILSSFIILFYSVIMSKAVVTGGVS